MSDGPADVMTSLRSAPVFRDVPEAVLQRLAPSARLLRLSRNEAVFQRGQACEGLHLLLAGQVKVYARVDKAADASPDGGTERGHEKVIEVMMAPACLGESMLGGEDTHSVNATMLTDGVLLLLPPRSRWRKGPRSLRPRWVVQAISQAPDHSHTRCSAWRQKERSSARLAACGPSM